MTLLGKAQDLLNKGQQKLEERKAEKQTTDNTPAKEATPATTECTVTGATSNENPASTNHGPHSSDLANKLDPKVNSDLDGKHAHGEHHNQHAHHKQHAHHDSAITIPSSTVEPTSFDNLESTNAGRHSSNLTNTVDRRIDSDRDGRNDPTPHTGELGQTQVRSLTKDSITPQPTPTTPSTTQTSNVAYDNSKSDNTGPHSSNIANKLDPRVDSDRDNVNDSISGTAGYEQTETGPTTANTDSSAFDHNTTQTDSPSTASYDNPQSSNAGPHKSNLLNKLDPRIDSDRDEDKHTTSNFSGGSQTSTGLDTTESTAASDGTSVAAATYDNSKPTNADPHDTNAMNELNPRMDSHRGTSANPAYASGGLRQSLSGLDNTTSPATHNNTSSTTAAQDNPDSTNAGPHGSKVLNKLDPRVDADRDSHENSIARTGGFAQTGTGVNTATPAAYDDTSSNTVADDNPKSTNAGPHSRHILNKLDPRVDPNRDSHDDAASHTGFNTTTGATVYDGTTSSSATYNDPESTNAGPHSSDVMNKLDPHVDSKQDAQYNGTTSTSGIGSTEDSYGTLASTHQPMTTGQDTSFGGSGTETTSSDPTFNNPSSTTTDGPHKSDLVNKLDPRVDSDQSSTTNQASTFGSSYQQQSHLSGYDSNSADESRDSGVTGCDLQYNNPRSTSDGPHDSNLMNKLDPRVDSDRDNTKQGLVTAGDYGDQQHYSHHAGPAPNAGDNSVQNNPKSTNDGPHSSNLLNKLDPRVDSDNSKGQNLTSGVEGYDRTQGSTAY